MNLPERYQVGFDRPPLHTRAEALEPQLRERRRTG